MNERLSTPLLLAALATVLALSGCREIQIPPPGSYSKVLLVTEQGARGELHQQLEPLIARELDYVISQETSFDVTAMAAVNLEDFPPFKNIVVVGVADPSTDVGARIISWVGSDTWARIRSGEVAILKKDNLPGAGQVTLIITAPSYEALQDVLTERGEEIADVLESSCRERLRRYLCETPNQKLQKSLLESYGFYLDVPYLYTLLSDETEPPGVEIIRDLPTRILGVYWRDQRRAPTIHDADELFDFRAKYVWERYNQDKMDRDRVRFRYERFGPYTAIKMAGYWYNDVDIVGGYFETFFVHDEDQNLLWAVDCLTYAPGRNKHPLVRELRALAETFRYDA